MEFGRITRFYLVLAAYLMARVFVWRWGMGFGKVF
jgi:hypothetical protein